MTASGVSTFHIAGPESQAAARGAVLVAACAPSLLVVHRIAGTRVCGRLGRP